MRSGTEGGTWQTTIKIPYALHIQAKRRQLNYSRILRDELLRLLGADNVSYSELVRRVSFFTEMNTKRGKEIDFLKNRAQFLTNEVQMLRNKGAKKCSD